MATNRSGLGSGTPTQELERWLKEAGRVTVHDEGEQHRLFDDAPVRMYRLFNKNGESITLTADTAQKYGLRPTHKQPRAPIQRESLFAAPQCFMFTEEV